MAMIDKAIAWYEHLSQQYFNDAVISVHRDYIKEGENLSRKAREYKQVVEWLRELKQLREERPIKQVTCKDCKNLRNDWGTLRCDYTGDIVDDEWYCKAAKAREDSDE